MWKSKILPCCWRRHTCKWCRHLQTWNGSSSRKLNRVTTMRFLGIYPAELKTHVRTKTHMWVFMAAFLRIAETWMQSVLPRGWWVNNMQCIQTALRKYNVSKQHRDTTESSLQHSEDKPRKHCVNWKKLGIKLPHLLSTTWRSCHWGDMGHRRRKTQPFTDCWASFV